MKVDQSCCSHVSASIRIDGAEAYKYERNYREKSSPLAEASDSKCTDGRFEHQLELAEQDGRYGPHGFREHADV